MDTCRAALEEALERPGVVTAPAGPNLADWYRKDQYRSSLQDGSLALVDSGALVLFWALLTGEWLRRESGLKFFREVLKQAPGLSADRALWVMPDEKEADRNRRFLRHLGVEIDETSLYCAPHYNRDRIEDPELLEHLTSRPVRLVFIQIGGGIQEPLAVWLHQRLPEPKPAIFCTGAAIAFLSGGQTPIPVWTDRLFLGWLWRIFSNPREYGRRYFKALRLLVVVHRWAQKEKNRNPG